MSQLDKSGKDYPSENNEIGFNPDIFGNVKSIALGEYNHSNKTIILYIKSILNSVLGKYTNESIYSNFAHRLLAVLVHELFHACHAFDYDALGHCWNNDAHENETIIESLAAYFEWCFLWDELGRHDMSDEMYAEWKKHAAIVWPYAGAKYIQFFIVKHHEFTRYSHELYRYGNNRSCSQKSDEKELSFPPILELSRVYDNKATLYGGKRGRSFYNLSLSGLGFAQDLLLDFEIEEMPFSKILQARDRKRWI